MPRPKRTKVAPSAPAPRPRNSRRSGSRAPGLAFDDLYDISDPECVAATGVGNIKRNGQGTTRGNPQRGATQLDAQEFAQNEASSGARNIEESTHTTPDAQRVKNNAEMYADESSLELEVSRRELAPGTGTFRRTRHSSFLSHAAGRGRSNSVESNLEDNGLTSIGGKNSSGLTTGYRGRRSRQGSVTGRNPYGMASSSMGTPAHAGSALKLGNFRRRAREPSILGTARKERQPQPDSDLDDEEDFNPDDESTPLNLSKTKPVTSSPSMSGSNPRKRKLSAVQVPASCPTSQSPGDNQGAEMVPTSGSLSDDEEESGNRVPSSFQESPIPSVEARPVTPELMSPTMAPPQSTDASSSPELPSSIRRPVSRGRRPLRGRTPAPMTQDSPISSPPSLTHSPNRAYVKPKTTKAKKQAPPPSTYSTAQLQALLPRRRRHATRDPFDIPSSGDEVDTSGLASDDDELSHLNVRARSRRGVLSKTLGRGSKKAPKRKPAPKPTSKSIRRTYGSRANVTSDKENEGYDPDDSLAPLPADENGSPENSQELEARIGKELKSATRKFEEVDKWELEFEDVTASGSSPKNAR
ncbi:uncharacterized protein BP5553_05631 [Venustampulla echinocandica]|uniref:Uncharacterized protein n=1 Tax=Venustampulla echinocandica TaxID=2656787 RepID=A0A370TRS2_9HELO|nr:uncharacterized protein BP5553_05631 [Venustampulla echinocandica]RDL38198.1 hypothetical protein BP5553_05631 [Venustampulla echinocandica]